MAEMAASCEPFYTAPSGGTTAASYAHQAHAPAGFHEYTLVAKRDAGRDSKLLTFALPDTMPTLGASVISGVKVKQEVAGEQLDKSYSPTSPAERTETFDLLVKAYAPRKGGGLGAWLCALEPGQNASMKVKGAKKIVDGAPLAYCQRHGRGPGVFFLGGFNSDMRGNKATALDRWCAGAGRAFTRFDYRGHGESGGRLVDGTIGGWLDDAARVLDAAVVRATHRGDAWHAVCA